MPDVGDQVTASLTVTPHDGTTLAALTVLAPDGTTSHPTASTADDGATWSAPLTYTTAGVWRLSWSVTGMGASVEHEMVSVAPTPGTPTGNPDRVYATTTQLANYLGAAPPLDSARLLLRASELLDSDFLVPAMYNVDEDGMPTDPEVIAGFAQAVCAQIEFWSEVGEETDISGPLESASIGAVALKYKAGSAAGGGAPTYYAPKLIRALISLPSHKFRMRLWSAI